MLSGILTECQMCWVQIRPDILSGLTWVQTVYIDYYQMMAGRVNDQNT